MEIAIKLNDEDVKKLKVWLNLETQSDKKITKKTIQKEVQDFVQREIRRRLPSF